ncbi:hypothetical protein CH365_17405 [Leptospira neocaledonica]|uniref:Uncharacterized protein n=1 Tax=Leptospira neocaledonica TaxID=2023192 RepID=A0A2M9ZV21_9LEPT|nr:hypothetical protein CH365_17405 [Leptospira neocaledonica]
MRTILRSNTEKSAKEFRKSQPFWPSDQLIFVCGLTYGPVFFEFREILFYKLVSIFRFSNPFAFRMICALLKRSLRTY